MTDSQLAPDPKSVKATGPRPVATRSDQYYSLRSGHWVLRRAIPEAEYRTKALWHIRALSTIAIVWAVLSIGAGIWAGVQISRNDEVLSDTASDSAQSSSYDECMADSTTTLGECEDL